MKMGTAARFAWQVTGGSDSDTPRNTVDAALCDLRNARGATWGMLKMAEADAPEDYQDLAGLLEMLSRNLESLWDNLDRVITDLESVMEDKGRLDHPSGEAPAHDPH